MALIRKCTRVFRVRSVVLVLVFFLAVKLVELLYHSAYNVALELAPKYLAGHFEFNRNKLNVYFVKLYNFYQNRRRRFRYDVEHERLENFEVKANEVLENYYYEEAEDATKSAHQVLLPKDNNNEARRTQFAERSTKTYRKPRPKYDLPLCPAVPTNLNGRLNVSALLARIESSNSDQFDHIEIGGRSMPANCSARHRVAILVPYRDRPDMLSIFPKYIHMFLRTQSIDYTLYVIEQIGGQTFNQGKLYNAGAIEALKLYDWQCFIFHDVDHFPVDDRNLYTCPQEARHMAGNVDKFHYSPGYQEFFGGVTAISTSVFGKIDGYSNDFWGWGGEDDDIYNRLTQNGFRVYRYPRRFAKYLTVRHERDKANPVNDCRIKILEATRNGLWPASGLSSLRYAVERIDFQPLYTRILIDVLEREAKLERADLMQKICGSAIQYGRSQLQRIGEISLQRSSPSEVLATSLPAHGKT